MLLLKLEARLMPLTHGNFHLLLLSKGRFISQKREAWLAWADGISTAGIGTEKPDKTDAAHRKSGGRKQDPVCGVMLFLPGFKSVLWNKVATVTINDFHD